MRGYWDRRYLEEGPIWGSTPSKTASYALELFQKRKIKSVLIPGAGYGRNSKLFSNHKLEVVGIEISKVAFEIAKNYDTNTKFILGSILDVPFDNMLYDAVYCFNTLHLFLEQDRLKFIRNCFSQVKNSSNSVIFFTVFSEKEKSFGRGNKLEENTFESKPGRPTHYFTEEDLIAHFRDFKLIETGIIIDKENHGESGIHDHVLRYIFASKE